MINQETACYADLLEGSYDCVDRTVLTKELRCGRVIAQFPHIVARLKEILDQALGSLQWLDRAFISDDTLERLPVAAQVGNTRVGGIDIGKPRMRAVLSAVMALAPAPHWFTVGELARKVHEIGERDLSDYGVRRAAYDPKKLRGKEMVSDVGRSRRYQVLPQGLRVIAGLVLLRDKVLKPLLAAMANPFAGNPARPLCKGFREGQNLCPCAYGNYS